MKDKLMILLVIIGIITGCRKDDSDTVQPSSQPSSQQSDLSSFDGTIRIGNNVVSTLGVVEVDGNNFSFVNEYGSMTGTANQITDASIDFTYNEITITGGDGIFEDAAGVQGEMYSDYLEIQGTSTSGQTVSITGALTIEEANAQWQADRSKASIMFTNLESCGATITINGETLGPLTQHWKEGGYCNTSYDDALTRPRNVDDKSSKLLCKDVTLEMLDGSTQTFNICDVVVFVIDKETTYNYTVSWDNGETTSGSINALEGGARKVVCLSNDGAECDPVNSDLITFENIVIDFENSNLGPDNYLPYIDKRVFSIYNTTVGGDPFQAIKLGDRSLSDLSIPSGYTNFEIKVLIRGVVANGTYPVETLTDNSPIALDVYYDGIPYSSAEFSASGVITISGFDNINKTCNVNFNKVNLRFSFGGGNGSMKLIFSGSIEGNFD